MTNATNLFEKGARERAGLRWFAGCLLASALVCGPLGSAQAIPFGAGQSLSALTDYQARMDHNVNEAPLQLVVGRSVVVHTARPLRRVYIGAPEMIQGFNAGNTELVLTAKRCGTSSIVLWDAQGDSYMYAVTANFDAEGLRESLRQAFPDLAIEVAARDGKLFLYGVVNDQATFDAVGKVAAGYASEVVNGLRVEPSRKKQVQLKLRIIEVDRSKEDQLGINIFSGGNTPINFSTGQFSNGTVNVPNSANPVFSATDPLNFLLYNYSSAVGLSIQDLEQKQVLQILAEPTLTTLSGIEAQFLSGGEFPVPVVQGGVGNTNAVTIMYRPYGVKVAFTPTVSSDGMIHLKVAPEVSALDYTNSVTISGTTVPALSTRRAESEVVLHDGQSFMLSGLLDHRTTDSFSKTPGIADIPILGQLFHSKDVNRSVVELVVIVTATVLDPDASTGSPNEPVMAVPNMQRLGFDQGLGAQTMRPVVEVGVPGKQGEAMSTMRAVVALGYDAHVVRHADGYQAQVGPFEHRREADDAIAVLRQHGYAATIEQTVKRAER